MKVDILDLSFVPFITEEQIRHRIEEISALLSAKYSQEQPIFLGMLSGAFVFMSDIIRAYPHDCEVAFVKYSSYDGTQSTGTLSESLGVKEEVKDRVVILIEDIIDTGFTLSKFLPRLRSYHPKEVVVVSLLTKSTALSHDVQIDHVGFDIPDKFVVGYGLDYNGVGRNLKDIYVLSDEAE